MTNPIIGAVQHLKQEAMTRAEQTARQIIANVQTKLETVGFDRQQAAPYPKSHGGSRADYQMNLARYKLYCSLVRSVESTGRPGAPDYVVMCETKMAKFIEEARDNAAFQYEAFVAKLISKIGDTTTANLVGDHVWSWSFLTVELPGGEKQMWKTQMIINTSKLGKVFNQFPTRKVKMKGV